MRVSVVCSLLLFISLFSLFYTPIFAEKKGYIVYLGSHRHHLHDTANAYDSSLKYHRELLASCLGSEKRAKSAIFYSYNRFINGFAAVLSDEEVAKVRKHPKVISVFLNRGRKVRTTNSMKFLGLENNNNDIPLNSAWKKANFGENVIIGNIDSGVWPESQSFSDEGMGPIPKKWRGTCQTNQKDGVKCNRKLIGVRYFNRGYLQYARRVARRENSTYIASTDLITARDFIGHGTHTLATAGGNFVPNASVEGYGFGTAKGGSPKARVATYKVCWIPVEGKTCFDADIMAAFEAAISDGVDIISLSLGAIPLEYFEDAYSIGSFHAVKNGILVVTSAGNSGPKPKSVENMAPWFFTIGASTMNREFVNYITLGNNKSIQGSSLNAEGMESNKLYPLIAAADAKFDDVAFEDASVCLPGSLDAKKVQGKILVCLLESKRFKRDLSHFSTVIGANGLILANTKELGDDVSNSHYILPTSQISFKNAQILFAYINSAKNPTARIGDLKTEFNTKPAPIVASFSSRGPSELEPAILKPDVIAPGVNIISAFTGAMPPSESELDERRVPYIAASGTSCSCPIVAGIAGLLKAQHPDWTPAAIKSAIMTTSTTKYGDLPQIPDFDNNEANPLQYGAGHINPNNAMDPGLIYDLNADNYLNYLCYRGYNQSVLKAFTITHKPYNCPKHFNIVDFNYPSILVPYINGSVTVNRFLKNVGSPGTYNVSFKAPSGVSISVEPKSLTFTNYGEEKRFQVFFNLQGSVNAKDYVFGELTWSDGYHFVRSPIVVKL